jgi:hypothetical protein
VWRLFYMGQRFGDCALLWLALMLLEIGLQLEFSLVGIQQEFLSSTECQPANVTIGHAGRGSNEADDLEQAISHEISWQAPSIPSMARSCLTARLLQLRMKTLYVMVSGDGE